VSNFEFVFSLLVIILGLGLAEVLGGIARAVKRRDALRIGWGTGLLATWVMTETVIFWEIIWQSRDVLTDNSIALFPGFVVTGLYYFAGALVFPDDLDRQTTLDDYFMREKAKVIGAVLAAVALAFGWRRLAMGATAWAVVPWYAWASLAIIYVAGPLAMLTRRRKVAIAALALLVVCDLLDPIESILWP
jgi:hypothetical protein